MKQNFIWVVLAISCLTFCSRLQAQTPRSSFTFKVKKTNSAAIPERARDAPAPLREVEIKPSPKYNKFPVLIGGEFGLLRVEPFDSTKLNLVKSRYNYAVFSYTVGKNGKSKDFILHQANDLGLKSVIYESLLRSDWRPATNEHDQPCEYAYPKQILLSPLKSYDYERHSN